MKFVSAAAVAIVILLWGIWILFVSPEAKSYYKFKGRVETLEELCYSIGYKEGVNDARRDTVNLDRRRNVFLKFVSNIEDTSNVTNERRGDEEGREED